MSSKENLVKTYQKKTDKEHVLDNPDTYTGSMEFTDCNWCCFTWTKLELLWPV